MDCIKIYFVHYTPPLLPASSTLGRKKKDLRSTGIPSISYQLIERNN